MADEYGKSKKDSRGRSARAAALEARMEDIVPPAEGDDALGGGGLGLPPMPEAESSMGMGDGIEGALAAFEEVGASVPPELQGEFDDLKSRLQAFAEKLGGGSMIPSPGMEGAAGAGTSQPPLALPGGLQLPGMM